MLHLQSIDEVGPLVAHLVNLCFTLAFDPVVPLACSSFSILPPQQYMLEDTASKQEHGLVCKDCRVAGFEARFVFGAVDIGGHYTVQISPSDDKAQLNTSENVNMISRSGRVSD